MIPYRVSQFIFDAQSKLDELAYGAYNLADLPQLTKEEADFLRQLNKKFCFMNDTMMAQYTLLREMGELCGTRTF